MTEGFALYAADGSFTQVGDEDGKPSDTIKIVSHKWGEIKVRDTAGKVHRCKDAILTNTTVKEWDWKGMHHNLDVTINKQVCGIFALIIKV